jgi:hypothetical protein
MIKIKTEFKVWKFGLGFEFNLLKWKVGVTLDYNQHAEYLKFHLGPITLSLLWDANPWN